MKPANDNGRHGPTVFDVVIVAVIGLGMLVAAVAKIASLFG